MKNRQVKSKAPFALAGAALLAVLLWALLTVLKPTPRPRVTTTLSVRQALAPTEIQGYAQALEPRPFVFPADHGPHPEFRSEWWYFTGNLRQLPEGRRFGFQVTFFRQRLAPLAAEGSEELPPRSSEWATDEIYMAHLAIADIEGESFHSFERFARPVVQLAGAEADPFRVWLEDWSARATRPTRFALPELRLQAAQEGVGLDLTLRPVKPHVLHGDHGLSHKSASPGNASYYYSFTRLAASGEIHIGARSYEVTGRAWMDREWSTSALAENQVGWDWFSLQLDDGFDLMIYRMRRADGTIDPASDAVLIDPDGGRVPLAQGELSCEILDRWTSPASGARYPVSWRLRAPAHGLELRVRPRLEDQELRHSLRYWEGAVAVDGSHRGHKVSGDGYLELTGY